MNRNTTSASQTDQPNFGWTMQGRNFVGEGYRFGLHGKEKDLELNSGNNFDYGWRDYDPRIGRWKSRDALQHPYQGQYNAFNNNPILYVDPNGLDNQVYLFLSQSAYNRLGIVQAKMLEAQIQLEFDKMLSNNKIEVRLMPGSVDDYDKSLVTNKSSDATVYIGNKNEIEKATNNLYGEEDNSFRPWLHEVKTIPGKVYSGHTQDEMSVINLDALDDTKSAVNAETIIETLVYNIIHEIGHTTPAGRDKNDPHLKSFPGIKDPNIMTDGDILVTEFRKYPGDNKIGNTYQIKDVLKSENNKALVPEYNKKFYSPTPIFNIFNSAKVPYKPGSNNSNTNKQGGASAGPRSRF